MAKIMGSCSGPAAAKYDLWLEVKQNSQSITNNTSNVTVALKLKRNDGYAASAYNLNTNENSVVLKVGDSVKVNKNLKIDTRNSATVTLATWTGNVTHNSDGTLKLSLSGSFTMSGTSLAGGSVSGSFTCTTIKRVSTLTLGSNSVIPGNSFEVGISGVDSFSHKISCRIGDNTPQTTSFAAGVTSGIITIPLNWASYLPNSATDTIDIVLYTYSGDTPIGSKNYSIKVEIPNNATFKPTYTLTLQRIDNGVPSSYGLYVSGVSQFMAVLTNISCKYGASLKSISIEYNDITSSSNNAVFNVSGSGTQAVVVRLTDSRGNYTEITQYISVVSYNPPSVVITNIVRCNADRTTNINGTYLKVVFESDYTPVNGNKATLTLSYAKKGGATLGTINPTTSPAIIGGGSITSSSYEVSLTINDTIKSYSIKRIIGTPKIPFNAKLGGTGVGIGCYAENDNELTIGYDVNIKGNLLFTDITSYLVINSTYFKDLIAEVRYYPCLDMTFFKMRAITKTEIPHNTLVTLATISANKPTLQADLNTLTGSVNYDCRAFILTTGEIKFGSYSTALQAGKKVCVSGVWLNTGNIDEEF